jgi:hypothetical protein
MVQINTPYPATAYLKGFLDERFPAREVVAVQDDPALKLVQRLFCREGLAKLRKVIGRKTKVPELEWFLDAFDDYSAHIETAVAYLQGRAPQAEKKMSKRDLLPEGPRFQPLHEGGPYLEQFEELSRADKAQHIASLFLDDVADFFKLGADPRFQFSRYGEKLAASSPSFDPMEAELNKPATMVDEALDALTHEMLDQYQPEALLVSVPFAGTVYAGFRMGRIARARGIPVLLGGGYANTELRSLSDARVFDYVDFISLDDGERPLLTLIEHLQGKRARNEIFRTYYRAENKVMMGQGRPGEKDIPFPETGTPSYEGLPLNDYISMYEMLNPVTKLWSGYFWNKLTLAHGCYWHRCSFCDTNLDYIGRYEAEKATRLVDRMEKISKETGRSGFHFVDEAAPPAILRALSEEILKRDLKFEWWGNIRFDKAFTPELCQLMQKAGCIAVTGGLEVASPRILKLIDKGVTVEQVARVTQAFQKAGVFVHAYLMFGFPTQTEQETVDSLEVVRQLFSEGCLQSAFWHRFAATVHSPVGHDPAKFGIRLLPLPVEKRSAFGNFSQNDLLFEDPTEADHDSLGVGLRAALYNYMHGVGLEEDVRSWFSREVPNTTIPATFIANAL